MNLPPSLVKLSRPGDLPCPACACTMQPYRCDSVVIDMCNQCAGIWFDPKEIGVFRRALQRFDYSNLKMEPNLPAMTTVQLYECPRCAEPLCEATYAYNSGVHVHTCTSCKGLWLPLDEIVNLIGLAKQGQDLAPDLGGFLREWTALEAENRRFGRLKSVLRTLMSNCPRPWGFWW